MRYILQIILLLALTSCGNKFFEFVPYDYDKNESAKIDVKGLKGCSFKLYNGKLYFRQKIKLRNSGMPKYYEPVEKPKAAPRYTENMLGDDCNKTSHY